MLLAVGALLLLTSVSQAQPSDRNRAESLARAGRNVEALSLFERVVEADPADVEAQLWVARLALRLGRTAEAEAGFRAVLAEHPHDVDAHIGLGTALTRTGATDEALATLRVVEEVAGTNPDLLGALARAYRRHGDDASALLYFQRARAAAPEDPDLAAGFEAVARAWGHWVAIEGFAQDAQPGSGDWSGTLSGSARLSPRLHLEASGRVQDGAEHTDTLLGGGFTLRAARAVTVSASARGGRENVALPTSDLSAEVVGYVGAWELGAGLRRLSFAADDVRAVSPMLAFNPDDRWRLDARYTWSRTSFDATGTASDDNSIALRATWQGWRRVALQASYAYGIESFEDLTADRIGALGTNTVATGARVDLPSLFRVSVTWEHQWRSNDSTLDRLTLSVVRFLP